MALNRAGQADPERPRREVGCAGLRLNGRLRDECLNETLFTSLAEARALLNAWQHDYNTVRPHSKLGGRSPAEIAGRPGWGHASNPVAIPSTLSHQKQGLYL